MALGKLARAVAEHDRGVEEVGDLRREVRALIQTLDKLLEVSRDTGSGRSESGRSRSLVAAEASETGYGIVDGASPRAAVAIAVTVTE